MHHQAMTGRAAAVPRPPAESPAATHLPLSESPAQPQPLAHFDSSLRVAYAGVGELGYAYIPAGLIDEGRAKDMSASFDVPAFPTTQQQQVIMAADTVIMEVESLLLVKGRVTMLRRLAHRRQSPRIPMLAHSRCAH
jgi:hypothetical protein